MPSLRPEAANFQVGAILRNASGADWRRLDRSPRATVERLAAATCDVLRETREQRIFEFALEFAAIALRTWQERRRRRVAVSTAAADCSAPLADLLLEQHLDLAFVARLLPRVPPSLSAHTLRIVIAIYDRQNRGVESRFGLEEVGGGRRAF